jgi:tetratricopeptide (TPR) repeat protein
MARREITAAEVAEAEGDLTTALHLYAADAAVFPLDVARRLRWVGCLRRLGQHDGASAALAEGLALVPAAKELLAEQVVQLRIGGRLDAAEAAIEALATQDPEFLQLSRLRAEVAEAGGDLETALLLYTADAIAMPRNATRRRRWVRCLKLLGQQFRALAAAAEGLPLDPAVKDLLVRPGCTTSDRGAARCGCSDHGDTRPT